VRTIAVVARKGGSGKTTVAINLALAAHLSGKPTALIDLDPQRSTLEPLRTRLGSGPQRVEATSRGLYAAQAAAVRGGVEALVVDTPAGAEEGMSNAIVLSDLTLLVVRPTFLDLTAAVQTAEVLRWLRKPGLVLINQAPASRDGMEPPAVRKALRALAFLGLPIVPVVLRARASYQTAMERGCSVLESEPDGAAARELGRLWRFIDQLAFAPLQRLERRA
jgi:chromosome partitioning protein